ncbi:hypothetical protein [Pseudomonas sp. SDO5271_S396]
MNDDLDELRHLVMRAENSREYARLFGLPPVKDAARFKSPA